MLNFKKKSLVEKIENKERSIDRENRLRTTVRILSNAGKAVVLMYAGASLLASMYVNNKLAHIKKEFNETASKGIYSVETIPGILDDRKVYVSNLGTALDDINLRRNELCREYGAVFAGNWTHGDYGNSFVGFPVAYNPFAILK